ncbi:imidazole glycerol phosphate synthase subunit HisH [Robertmurraya sp. Marseille-Q9965]
MIGIIDYGMGNLFSVSKALERLDVEYFISEEKEQLLSADALILPGVGAFPDAMERLNETGLTEMIQQFVESGKPLLGICLGMQLLFDQSEENILTKGLAILPGEVVRFTGGDYKVPHMGWNRLKFNNSSTILANIEEDFVYFVHSYYVKTMVDDVVIASCKYDVEVPAVVGRGNVFGMQFHPEKSGKLGMELLRNFTELTRERMSQR